MKFEQLVNEVSKETEKEIKSAVTGKEGVFGGLEKGLQKAKTKWEPYLPTDIQKDWETRKERIAKGIKGQAPENPLSDPTLDVSVKPDVPPPMIGITEKEYDNYRQLSYVQFLEAMNVNYNSKTTLVVFGEPGIGKSAGVVHFCQAMAAKKGKTFVFWNSSKPEVMEEVFRNPEKYFVLVDIRTAQMEPPDIVGIPDISDTSKWLKTKQTQWIWVLTRPNMDGVLFFDEINQAKEEVQNALYQVILDRVIFDKKLAGDVGIFGAGNIGEYWIPSGGEELKGGLAARPSQAILIIQPQEWFDWAEEVEINPLILEFIRSNPEQYFYKRPTAPKYKYPSPRSFEQLTDAMEQINLRYQKEGDKMNWLNEVHKHAQMLCGNAWAQEFRVFLISMKSFNWEEIVKDPAKYTDREKIKMSTTEIWAFLAFLREKVTTIVRQAKPGAAEIPPKSKKMFEEVVHVLSNSNPEWTIVLYNIIKRMNVDWIRTFLAMAISGNYDPKIKQEFNTKLKPQVETMIAAATSKAGGETKYVTTTPTPTQTTETDPYKAADEMIKGIETESRNIELDLARIIYKKSRFNTPLLTEEEKSIIGKHPLYALLYAVNSKKGPFMEGENAIYSVVEYANAYEHYFGKNIKGMNKKFNTLTEEIEYVYTTEATIPLANPNIGEGTPIRDAIMSTMDTIEDKYNIDWSTVTPEQLDYLNQRLPEILVLTRSKINASRATQMEKEMMIQQLVKIEDLLSLFVTFTCRF